MRKTIHLLIGIFLLLTALACQPGIVHEQYKAIENRSWDKDSTLVFTIPVKDTLQNYNLVINVRNDVNYKYSNLWLFINIRQPDGQTLEDKFEIILADPIGKWLGSGFGGLKTREALYKSHVFFPVSGDYTITVQQGMREEVLKGISDVGIRVEKVE